MRANEGLVWSTMAEPEPMKKCDPMKTTRKRKK
jgi:hypothetical protein